MAYVAIEDTEIDPESPYTTTLATKMRDNPIAITEGAPDAPKIQGAAMVGYTAGNYIFSGVAKSYVQTAITTYTKTIEFKIVANGTIRITFDLQSNSVSYTAYARIYKNGVAFGTERTVASTTPSSFTEDLAFSSGDLVQLYMKNSNGASGVSYTSNFYLKSATSNHIMYTEGL